MTARGYADDAKVSVSGDVMLGPLHFEGSPPFTVAAGVIGGTAVLDGTSDVNVSTTAVDDDSIILLSVMPGSAPAGIAWVSSVTPGAGFTMASTSSSDTAVVICWYIVETA